MEWNTNNTPVHPEKKMKTTKCLLALMLSTAPVAVMAEDIIRNRIDFQTDVETVATNDLLTANLSIEAGNRNPTALARELTQKINDALKQAGAYKTVKLTSGNQQTWPVYTDKNKLDSWRGRAEVRLESQDFKSAGELISVLQGNLQLNGLHFNVAPTTRRDLENQLTEQAVQAFRQRADRIRQAWNAKSYRLVQMSIGTANPPAPPPMYAMRAAKAEMADAPAAEYAGGESRLSVQVSGSIELEP
ncbi:MAG TPA: SIMPL domain-containing protein [Fluviicoccus sp.]|nr:SIMPL domain-containing protein [Fluviicoccus sp.]